MRILSLGCSEFSYVCTTPLVDSPDPAKLAVRMVARNALVLLVSVEQGDSPSQVRRAADRVRRIAEYAEITRVVIDGFAHLSNRLATPDGVRERLGVLADALHPLGVHMTPFGWNKLLHFDVTAEEWSHRYIHT